MALPDSTFSIGGTTFAGRELNEVEFGAELEFDDAGQGKASRFFAVKYDDAKSFRNAAVGAVESRGGLIYRTDAARHPDFRELVAQSVLFVPLAPPQPGEGDDYNWLKAQVVYVTPKAGDAGEKTTPEPGTDTGPELARWGEDWQASVEVVPTEIKTGGSYTITTPVYFPITTLQVTQKRVPSFDPSDAVTLIGKINLGTLITPSGSEIPTLCALYAGFTARWTPQEVDEGDLVDMWEISHRFLVRPQSWNLGPGRDGAVPFDKALTWPGTGNALYDSSATLQLLLINPADFL